MHEILQEADAVQAEFWAHFDEFVGSQDEDRVA
jgi:hypothetical protein